MRIGLFTDTYLPDTNGCARSVANLKAGLEALGHKVFVVCPNPKVYKFDVVNEYVFLPSLQSKWYNYRFSFPFSKKTLKNTIKGLELDVIHLHTEFAISILTKRFKARFKLPMVYTFHTFWSEYANDKKNSAFYRFFYKRIYKISLKNVNRSNYTIVPSNKTLEALKLIPQIKNKVKYLENIPSGFDIDVYRLSKLHALENHYAKRKQYNINPMHKVHLFLGRIAHEKNLKELLEFYGKFVQKNPNNTLVLAGHGPILNELKEFVKQNLLEKNVVFTGMVHPLEVQYIYAMADIFINSSTTETQGLTTLEGLAAMSPVLLRDSGIKYIQDQVTGAYYSDYESFEKELNFLNKLIDTNGEVTRNKCYESVKPFSHIEYAKKVEKVYKLAINLNKLNH